jgi:hypothetical protein
MYIEVENTYILLDLFCYLFVTFILSFNVKTTVEINNKPHAVRLITRPAFCRSIVIYNILYNRSHILKSLGTRDIDAWIKNDSETFVTRDPYADVPSTGNLYFQLII